MKLHDSNQYANTHEVNHEKERRLSLTGQGFISRVLKYTGGREKKAIKKDHFKVIPNERI